MNRRRPGLAVAMLAAAVAALHGWLPDRLSSPPPSARPAALETVAPRRAPVAGAVLVAAVTATQPSLANDSSADPLPATKAITAAAPTKTVGLPVSSQPAALPEPAATRRVVAASEGSSLHREPADPAPSTERPAEPAAEDAAATPVSGAAPVLADPASSATAVDVVAADATARAGSSTTPHPTTPTPVYRTRIPPSANVTYRLRRGFISGSGELDWRVGADGYELRLEGKLPLIGTLITETSRGRFDAAGLAPERHTDRRLRRSEQAANFQRAQGKVSFSGGAEAMTLVPGMQDRLSVWVQLAAIAAAGPQPPAAGQEFSIPVVGVRGDVAVWVLGFQGVQVVETESGSVSAWRYVRQAESPYETRAEFWLDPARHYLPVRVRLTDGSGDPLELIRESRSP